LSRSITAEAWVRRVAMNVAVSAARRARRRTVASGRLGPQPAVPELTDGTLWVLHIFEAKVSRIAPHR
jgi:hypothetical protein